MARIIDAFTQFFDDNGDPLVDGFLKFVESGTNNTDKDTSADVNETIPNANPVPLDGAGRCPNVFGISTFQASKSTTVPSTFLAVNSIAGSVSPTYMVSITVDICCTIKNGLNII